LATAVTLASASPVSGVSSERWFPQPCGAVAEGAVGPAAGVVVVVEDDPVPLCGFEDRLQGVPVLRGELLERLWVARDDQRHDHRHVGPFRIVVLDSTTVS